MNGFPGGCGWNEGGTVTFWHNLRIESAAGGSHYVSGTRIRPHPGHVRYCAVAPESRTICIHTGVSWAMNVANSAADPGRSKTLSLARLSFASGERRMSLMVVLSLSTIGRGVFGG